MRRQRILSRMKRVEMIVERERLDELITIVERNSTGYTLIPDVTGLGSHGLRERNMALVVTVVTEDHLEAIIEAVLPSMNERSNIMLITDVTVLRAEHFIPEVRAATTRANV